MLVNEQISFHSRLRSRESGVDKVGRGRWVGFREPCRASDFDPGHTSAFASRGRTQEISHVHQIIGRGGPSEHPADSLQTSKVRLAHQGHGLEPREDFFHSLPFRVTRRVARMPSGASIDRTAARPFRVLRDMGRDLQRPQRCHLRVRVIILVASQSESPALRRALCLDHLQRRPALERMDTKKDEMQLR